MKSTTEAARLFQIWAPPGVVWSRWVKPVIFAQEVLPSTTNLDPSLLAAPSPKSIGIAGRWPGEAAQPVRSTDWANDVAHLPLDQTTALVIDLPGVDALEIGLLLAARGVRPAPLFNTCNGPAAVINLNTIIERLEQGATTLQQLSLPMNAPPAFLLDSKRNPTFLPPEPGDFDNRWLVFPYDFPSATFLATRGIKNILLLYHNLADDLSHVLQRWHDAGLTIFTQRLPGANPLQPYRPFRPPYFRRLWSVFLLTVAHKLHYSNVGGFGAMLPHSSGGRTG